TPYPTLFRAAAADLNQLGAQGLEVGQGLLEGGLADDVGKHAKFHNGSTPLCLILYRLRQKSGQPADPICTYYIETRDKFQWGLRNFPAPFQNFPGGLPISPVFRYNAPR